MRISPAMIKNYSRMGQKGAFSGIGMVELAQNHDDVRAVVADSVAIASLDRFFTANPDKLYNAGIAEQNMVSIAAGLASEGDIKSYAFTYAEYVTIRALEQVRMNLAVNKFKVRLVGNSAGFAMGPLGVSHWALEDIAVLRSMPDIAIISACDSLEAIKIALASYDYDGPCYIRLSGELNCPIVYDKDFDFTIGKAIKLRDGKDACVLATGMMVREALDAAEALSENGVECAVWDVHTIKPIDTAMLDEAFKNYPIVFTVEEHSITGGLGSSVCEYAADKTTHPPIVRIGAGDYYCKPGSMRYLWETHGMTSEKIAETILNKKGEYEK